MVKYSNVVFLIIFLSIIVFTTSAQAQIYNYHAVPDSNDTYTTALFRIYVPDSVSVVRGVYFFVGPWLNDSRPVVNDTTYRNLCESTGFALMGARLDNMHMESGIGDAVLRALNTFAILSDHSELRFSTIFFNGCSWGGQFGYHFTVWNPMRTIGFITQKGGYHDTTDAGNAIYVPGYLFIGEFDYDYRIENLTYIFEQHRPLGARWILAIEPDARHEQITDQALLNNYFYDVTALRLPETIPIDRPVELIIIDEADSWLGNRDTTSFAIGRFECYDEDVGQACWFPTREVGERWQAFVSDSTVTDTIPCDPVLVENNHTSTKIIGIDLAQNYPNPFNPMTTINFDIQDAGRVEVGVYNLRGQLVRVLLDDFKFAGKYSVIWDGKNANHQDVPSGIYFYRLENEHYVLMRKMVLVR